MRTLRVLGGLWLDDGAGPLPGRGAQRRRLALLTLLALSPGRRVTRDKAIATLWPENTSAEGRRRLSSAVYDLRSLLGDDAIESAGDELWIAPTAALRIDVDDFEAAFGRGDSEATLAAYGGPLLDGVHLSGAAEFEEWIASQRERLRRLYFKALEQAASARLSRGDTAGAVSAALQLLDVDPLSGHAALVAVNTLVSAGDRPRALQVLDGYAERVRRELGVDPDDAIVEVMRRLRVTPGSAAVPVRRDDEPFASEQSTIDSPRPKPAGDQPVVASHGHRWARRRSSVLLRGAAAGAIVIAALAGAAFRSHASAAKHESAGIVNVGALAAAAARSTKSAVALESFVEGESAHERGRYDAAVKFFRAAVAEDSAFALAHYRLSESMLWQEQPGELAAVHDSLALVWSSKLPDEERLLVHAYVAWRRGQYETADTLDQIAIRRDWTNTEAQFQFGEVLFHYNPLRGRSIGEARQWFERIMVLDSTNWGARWHFLLLDAARVSHAEFRDRVAQLLTAQPDGHLAAELRLFAADESDLPSLAAPATSSMLFDAAWRRAVFRRDLSGAETLLGVMADKKRNEFDRMVATNALASLRLGRGHADAAMPLLETEAAKRVTGGDAWAIAVYGLLANHADTASILDSLGRAIDHWRQTLAGFDPPSTAPVIVSRYLDGLLAVSRGDNGGALAAADDLVELGRRNSYAPAGFRSPGELAQSVRAYSHQRAGRCQAALDDLDQEKGSYWLGAMASSPLVSQGFERYIRAECLASLGRNAEAIRWFETLEQGSLFDLEFLSASLRGQAAAHRAMGDAEAAKTLERRLSELQAK